MELAMKPCPLRTRSDLLSLIRQNAPSKACERAIDEGRTIVLGGFAAPEELPCWLVEVAGQHGRKWWLGVEIDEPNYRFNRLYYADECDVPWIWWNGRADGRDPLLDGDMPEIMHHRRLGSTHYSKMDRTRRRRKEGLI